MVILPIASMKHAITKKDDVASVTRVLQPYRLRKKKIGIILHNVIKESQ